MRIRPTNWFALVALFCGIASAAEFTTADGLEFEFGGRLMLDAAWFDGDASDIPDDTEVRRARLFAAGTIDDDWGYKLQFEFSGGDVESKDVYLEHKPTRIRVGHFKQPFSLEEMSSSKYITFLERGLPVAFATSRRLGIGWNHKGDGYTFAAGVFDREADGGNQGGGAGARITYTPLTADNRLLHLGAAAIFEGPDDAAADTSRFRARPEAHLAPRLVDSGTLEGVDDVVKYGLEAAWVDGPLSLQAEYIRVNASRDNGDPDYELDGYYAYASYFLTGESRPYKSGVFGRLKPGKASGAWELALRYSTLDLDDGPVLGGEEDNVTLAVNYYPTSHVRIMANLVFVDSTRAGIDDDPRIFQIRGQVDF